MQPNHNDDSLYSPFIGQYCVVRCHDAGVWAGVVEALGGRSVRLSSGRRLWSWTPADGQKTLSGIAIAGLSAGRIAAPVETVLLTENCEVMLCSPEAAASIQNWEVVS